MNIPPTPTPVNPTPTPPQPPPPHKPPPKRPQHGRTTTPRAHTPKPPKRTPRRGRTVARRARTGRRRTPQRERTKALFAGTGRATPEHGARLSAPRVGPRKPTPQRDAQPPTTPARADTRSALPDAAIRSPSSRARTKPPQAHPPTRHTLARHARTGRGPKRTPRRVRTATRRAHGLSRANVLSSTCVQSPVARARVEALSARSLTWAYGRPPRADGSSRHVLDAWLGPSSAARHWSSIGGDVKAWRAGHASSIPETLGPPFAAWLLRTDGASARGNAKARRRCAGLHRSQVVRRYRRRRTCLPPLGLRANGASGGWKGEGPGQVRRGAQVAGPHHRRCPTCLRLLGLLARTG